jgi:chaperonin GroES
MTTDGTLKMKVSIHPLADRVVLRPIEETQQRRGELFIPAMAREKPQQGEVVAVGPGRYEKGVRVPMELSIGQTVLYDRYSGSEVTLDNEQYLIIEESEVLANVSE